MTTLTLTPAQAALVRQLHAAAVQAQWERDLVIVALAGVDGPISGFDLTDHTLTVGTDAPAVDGERAD